VFEVPLNPGPNGPRHALLREPSGRDESLFARQDPVFASELVGRLLVSVGGKPSSEAPVWSLSVADRDRLVAELFLRCFGDRVEAVATCNGCQKSFGFAFSLGALLSDHGTRLDEQGDPAEGPDASGVYRLQDGIRFRLPTAADERDVARQPAERATQTLLERCIIDGDPNLCGARVQEAMDAIAPVLSLDLPARCPLCSQEQQVPFDLVGFFMAALAREQPLLVREVHCLARAYRWSHAEILSLGRSERRAFVALVLAEHEARAGGLVS
jgi:hypothetical protein